MKLSITESGRKGYLIPATTYQGKPVLILFIIAEMEQAIRLRSKSDHDI